MKAKICMALTVALLLAGPAWAADLAVGDRAEVAGKSKLWPQKKGARPLPVAPGEVLTVKKLKRGRALVERAGDGATGWIKLKLLRPAPPAEPVASEPAGDVEAGGAAAAPSNGDAPPAEAASPDAGVAEAADAPAVAPEPTTRPLRVVVYDLQASGLDKRTAGLVGESLLAEIRKLRRVSAMGMAEITALLSVEEQKQLLGCDDESCLAEVAGALGSDDLVLGSLGRVGAKSVLSLKRLDMRSTGLKQSVNKTMAGSDAEETGEALLAAIGPSVEALFPDRPLRSGLQRGVAPEMARRLDPPPLPTWVFWATAGTAVAAGVAAGGMGVWHRFESNAYNDKADGATTLERAVTAEELSAIEDRAHTAQMALIGLGATAGALAVAAAVQALFTDWWGYREQGPTLTPMVTADPAGGAVAGGVITGVLR